MWGKFIHAQKILADQNINKYRECAVDVHVSYENPIFADPMGEKHNTWRAAGIPALLVVVRNWADILLTQYYIFF